MLKMIDVLVMVLGYILVYLRLGVVDKTNAADLGRRADMFRGLEVITTCVLLKAKAIVGLFV